MTAYDRVIQFLTEMGSDCLWRTEVPGGEASEWQISPGERIVLTRMHDGALQLFQPVATETRGRADHLMDRITNLAFPTTQRS